MNRYYLLCTHSHLRVKAQQLVDFTGEVYLVHDISQITVSYYLCLEEHGLYLYSDIFTPLLINDIYSKLRQRLSNITQELLYKAVHIKKIPDNQLRVLDVTAGLGKDSLILALAGFNVTLVEVNPILAIVLYYAWLHDYLPQNKCKVIYMNGIDYLNTVGIGEFNVVYLDPMFNHDKSAKAKKEMQLIQMLVENNGYNDKSIVSVDDMTNLFSVAKLKANKVVVKRDNKQVSFVSSPKPSFVKGGKTIRYDIYI